MFDEKRALQEEIARNFTKLLHNVVVSTASNLLPQGTLGASQLVEVQKMQNFLLLDSQTLCLFSFSPVITRMINIIR